LDWFLLIILRNINIKMLFSFASIFLLTIIFSTIKTQEIENDLLLVLLNGTSSCQINDQTKMGLCLDNEYSFDCYKYNNSNSNVSIALDCDLVNDNTNCSNITLYCMLQNQNITWTQTDFECMYSIYQEEGSENENNTLICYAAIPVSVSTTVASVSTTEESVYSTTSVSEGIKNSIRVYGMKITKHTGKIIAIVLLVVIILLGCFLLCGCISCCNNLCKSKTNYNNKRMPQSTVVYV